MLHVVGLAGSTRSDSLDRRLVVAALDACAAVGVETTLVDLDDHPLPIYDGDLEANEAFPASAQRLIELLMANHAWRDHARQPDLPQQGFW